MRLTRAITRSGRTVSELGPGRTLIESMWQPGDKRRSGTPHGVLMSAKRSRAVVKD